LETKCGVPANQYALVHNWLRRKYGAASKCDNQDCPKKSVGFHYALIKGKEYKKDRSNFMMLCRSCHAKYDWDSEKHKPLWVVTPERRINCSIAKTGTKASKETLDKMSARMSGSGNPMYGVRRFKEQNHFYGKKHSQDTKDILMEIRGGLTKEQVREIRSLYQSGMLQIDIAKKFNLNRPRVNKIIRFKIYKSW